MVILTQEFRLKREIEWIRGAPPSSEPPCGFNGSKCQYSLAFGAYIISRLTAINPTQITLCWSCRSFNKIQCVTKKLKPLSYLHIQLAWNFEATFTSVPSLYRYILHRPSFRWCVLTFQIFSTFSFFIVCSSNFVSKIFSYKALT